uniref:Glutamine synthetase n=1 Tax=Rhodosorus marinus TaxID=101924 RepID=A0A7S3EDQ4_9RHOD|mmetsp:Transcript_25450/g.100502  ORF Transcript_25450/g.100502 Transcript_25450/m.100502 type:complete len:408 (+) Transcript_25450:199-1422(+)
MAFVSGIAVGKGTWAGNKVASQRANPRSARAANVVRMGTLIRKPIAEELKEKYSATDIGGKVLAEYIWLGGKVADMSTGKPICRDATDIRSKTKVLDKAPESVADLPEWNYDGSSTEQAMGNDSEVMLRPVAIYKDPFRKGDNILVLCEGYTPQGEPLISNTRSKAVKIMDEIKDQEPWFGIEQEYTLMDLDGRPFGWPKDSEPGPQGPYYCGAGAAISFGREISDAHMNACLYAGLNVSGTNAEVMMSQWEYQVGPCVGIEAGDQMWVSRYIMQRLSEEFGIVVTFDPKPMPGDWNGAGCHTNFSTQAMRDEGGFEVIKEAMVKMGERHRLHIEAYGEGNERRLTGKHETANISDFKWGVADRGASIRIPRSTEAENKGYLEDRRPGSNMDPYVVTSLIVETCCLH